MNALLLKAPSRLELVDWPTPEPTADEVLLRIRVCGICGSDIHGWDGSSGRRNPPLIMGHEAAGEIAGVGSAVTGWKIGERVTFDSSIWCGHCQYCRAGQVNRCENRRVVGVAPAGYCQHGAFAEYLALPARIVYRLPENLSFRQAAWVEPISIAVHAVHRVKVEKGATAVVVGGGLIGLLVVQTLRWAGAGRIIVVEPAESRRQLALRLGATETLESNDGTAKRIVESTQGGADLVFECVGFAPTVNLAIAAAKMGGSVVLVGNLSPTTDGFPLQQTVLREVTIMGSCASAGEIPLCLELLSSGAIKTEPMTETAAPLSEGPQWFSQLSAPGGGKYMKVLLEP